MSEATRRQLKEKNCSPCDDLSSYSAPVSTRVFGFTEGSAPTPTGATTPAKHRPVNIFHRMSTVSLSKNIRRTLVRTSRNDNTPPTSVRAESTISRRPVTALTRGEPGRSAAHPQLSSDMPLRQSWKPPWPGWCWPWPPAEPHSSLPNLPASGELWFENLGTRTPQRCFSGAAGQTDASPLQK